MRGLGVVIALVAVQVHAAEVTRVASSLEDNDPFGMFLDIGFDRTQDRGKLVREWYQQGGLEDVTELRYSLYDTRMPLDVHVGIFRDLELHFGVPIVFQQDRYWDFAAGTDASNSTINRNCIDARGDACPTPGGGTASLFGVPASSYRSGLGNLAFGFAWAAYNQKKDDTKPTWVIRFDYTAPTAVMLNPAKATSSASRGDIGDRVHRFTLATAVSKRLSVIEPYFHINYTLPLTGPGFYSNCDTQTGSNLGRPENCGGSGWSRGDTGMRAPHTGNVMFGTELTVFERPDRFQRVAFDARLVFSYVSEGRYYNELSDLMGKLMATSDYAYAGGQLGFIGQAADFVSLKANASWGYNTERFLSNEVVGKDLNRNGNIDITTAPEEINPTFDFRVDRPGRRFRIQEQFVFRVMVTVAFNF